MINEILTRLIESSTNGSITWERRNSIFDSETSWSFRAYSIDKETWFDIDIKLNDNMTIQHGSSLWIYNKGLVDGKKLLLSGQYKDISKIEDFIYNNLVKPNIIKKCEDKALENILTGIADKQYIRDKKIGEILNGINPFKKLW